MGRIALLAAAAVTLVACGGRSSEHEPSGTGGALPDGTGGMASGGVSGGNAAGMSGAAVAGGSGGATGGGGDTSGGSDGTAGGGGTTVNCGGYHYTCCSQESGLVETAPCVDEKVQQCPDGSAPKSDNSACVPDGVNVSDCRLLQDLACEPPMLECHNGGHCPTRCWCYQSGDAFTWGCRTTLC